LGAWQLAQIRQDRPEEFVQSGERQVGLGLHADRGQHQHRRRVLPGVAEQR
jgi:hypothetical protein